MSLEALLLRLLLLHEVTSRFPEAGFTEVLRRAEEGVGWIFPGARLRALSQEEGRGQPERGLARLEGKVGYGAYFPGPPNPFYLFLDYPQVEEVQELRLAALFLDHLLAALKGAGYRDELERQARTDWLTGLANRRALERALRRSLPLGTAFLLMDLDGLKAVNDQEGHLAGDALLKSFASLLQGLAQTHGGKAFRLGGDEFALILPREALEEALEALQAFPVSVGIALPEEAQGEALLDLADQRMYQEKRRRKGLSPEASQVSP